MDRAATQARAQNTPARDAGWAELDLKQMWGMARRRIWLIVTAFVIVATVGTVHAFKATPVYRAVARIELENPGAALFRFKEGGAMPSSDRYYDKTQQEVLRSRVILEKTVNEDLAVRSILEGMGQGDGADGLAAFLGEVKRTVLAVLGTVPSVPPEPWEKLREMVRVQHVRDTHILEVYVESEDPKQAATLVNAVTGKFRDFHSEASQKDSTGIIEFLKEERLQQEAAIDQAEASLLDERAKANVGLLTVADRDNPVLVKLNRLNEKLTETQLHRIELEAQLRVVNDALDTRGETEFKKELVLSLAEAQADQTLLDLGRKLVEAQQEAAGLGGTYGPGHPQILAAQAKVELIRGKLDRALPIFRDALDAQVQILTEQEAELLRRYEDQDKLASQLKRDAMAYELKQKKVDRQYKWFEASVERVSKVDLNAAYATQNESKTSVKIIEEAVVPSMPVRPRRARIVFLSVLLGLLAGVGLAFVVEYADDKIRTPEDLEERVGLPVLGYVPDIHSGTEAAEDFAYRGRISVLDPRAPVTEAYRTIRTSLFFSAPPEETKVVVITSGGAGDGKTTTASNLALIVAQSDKRVLLVDADLRKPQMHNIFGLERDLGLSVVLVGEASLAEAVQKVQTEQGTVANLDVLCAGPNPPNPAELLNSKRMVDLLAEAREKYDRIIIDTPPVLIVADAAILAGEGDAAVLVVKSARNTRSLVRRAREQLLDVKARVLGGILNDVRRVDLGYYQSDYYYHGYSSDYDEYYGSERTDGQERA